MSNINDFIKDELYPRIYDSVDTVFPEHRFRRSRGQWQSKTYLDGREHASRADKTVITAQAPGRILEQGGETKSLIDYVMERDRADFVQAVKTLAAAVGLELPSKDISPEYKEKQSLLEDCNSYFIFCLTAASGSDKVRAYLNERGYSEAEIGAMELGYIPSQAKLFKHLQDRGHSQRLIEETVTIAADTRIGSSHVLTIPYRSGGTLKGFKFRAIQEATPKYINTSGLDRNGGFFNLSAIRADKDLIIVEGELDSLHATVKGIDNVVATGGSSINEIQVRDAIKRGAKSFTLCFDTEPGKEEQTETAVNKAIEVILGTGVNRVYIVTLPAINEAKTDLDSYIKAAGIDAFRQLVSQAVTYFEYRLQLILNRYGRLEEQREGGVLTAKDIGNLLEDVITTAAKIPDPLDRDRFKKTFTSLEDIQSLGVTEEALSATLEQLTTTRDRQAQAQEFKRLLAEVNELHDRGDMSGALGLMEAKAKQIRLQDKATEFSSLLVPAKEDEIRQRLAAKPDSLNTGYRIGPEELLLPSGAISILAAPTSHGKTTFLINLAINLAKAYPDKEAYLFSYEEDQDSVLISALNTYLDEEISINNKRTIKSYLTTGSTQYIAADKVDSFTAKKERFFRELIDSRRLNIHYTSYDSDTLIDAIRYLYKRANPGVILIDYIQLLNLPRGAAGDKYKTYSRQEELKQICLALKDLAVETGLTIVLGAQFNRQIDHHLELHANKIGEAGDIERVASLILGLWNNKFTPIYGKDSEKQEIQQKGLNKEGTIYATVLKNRSGQVGHYGLLEFNGNLNRIKNKNSGDSYFE
jgi:DNA primase catalytic core